MNKDFRHARVNLSRAETWASEVRRRTGNAVKRAAHRRERRSWRTATMKELEESL